MVLTVYIIVTHPTNRNTRCVATLKLVRAAGGGSAVQFISTITAVILTITHKVLGDTTTTGTGEFQRRTGDVTAARLVFSVVTVSLAVTFPRDRNAQCGACATAKLIRTASSGVTHVNALVRAVFAVRFSIAVPPLGDTLAVAADKVLFLACLPHTRVLIASISAVHITVTLPHGWDAASVPTLEL